MHETPRERVEEDIQNLILKHVHAHPGHTPDVYGEEAAAEAIFEHLKPRIFTSGDHTDLLAVLRADRLPECSFDDGRTWEVDDVGVGEAFARAAEAIESLGADLSRTKDRMHRAIDKARDEEIAAQAAELRSTVAERLLEAAFEWIAAQDCGCDPSWSTRTCGRCAMLEKAPKNV